MGQRAEAPIFAEGQTVAHCAHTAGLVHNRRWTIVKFQGARFACSRDAFFQNPMLVLARASGFEMFYEKPTICPLTISFLLRQTTPFSSYRIVRNGILKRREKIWLNVYDLSGCNRYRHVFYLSGCAADDLSFGQMPGLLWLEHRSQCD